MRRAVRVKNEFMSEERRDEFKFIYRTGLIQTVKKQSRLPFFGSFLRQVRNERKYFNLILSFRQSPFLLPEKKEAKETGPGRFLYGSQLGKKGSD